jgi:hypothetical protein
MKEIDLPFSGKVAFADTVMVWPLNHMVSAKGEAVTCGECHTRENGRLAKLGGFYLPGRDRVPLVDRFGNGLALLTLLGVAVHGSARAVATRRRNGGSK